jgi:hypothetical protein
MKGAALRKYDRWIVIGLLGSQLLLFWLSLDALFEIGVFCTWAGSMPLALFGYVHLLYALLFLLGAASIFQPVLRLPYVAAILIALTALPVQIWLVRHHYLQCDGP